MRLGKVRLVYDKYDLCLIVSLQDICEKKRSLQHARREQLTMAIERDENCLPSIVFKESEIAKESIQPTRLQSREVTLKELMEESSRF